MELYTQLITTFEHLTALRHYRHALATDVQAEIGGVNEDITYTTSLGSALQQLHTLHLVDCDLPVIQVVGTVKLCTNLRKFCYRVGNCADFLDFRDLCAALSLSKDTLEYLHLSMGREFPFQVSIHGALPATCRYVDRLYTLAGPDCACGRRYGGSFGRCSRRSQQKSSLGGSLEPSGKYFAGFQFLLPAGECLPSSLRTPCPHDEFHRYTDEIITRDMADEACMLLTHDVERLPFLRTVQMLHMAPILVDERHKKLQACCLQRGIDFVAAEGIDDADMLRRYYAGTD